jgi:hypothetical protein
MAREDSPQDAAFAGAVNDGASTGDSRLGVPRAIKQYRAATTAAPAEAGSPNETTAVRREKLEAEIHRLSRLIEQSQQRGHQPPHVSDLAPRDTMARVYGAVGPIDTAELVVIVGRGRTYVLGRAEKGPYLSALNRDGRQIWVSHLPTALPIRGDGVEWTLEEPTDKKQVILTWARSKRYMRFCFDTNSGELLTEDAKRADREPRGNRQDVDSQGSWLELWEKVRVASLLAHDTDSQNSRLERLEKAVELLRTQLLNPARALSPATAAGAAYLQAVADVTIARSRVAQLTRHEDADSKAKLEEARIELEFAEKLARLLSGQIRADMIAAEGARKAAQGRYDHVAKLQERGYASQTQADVAKAALAEAEARVKQLESILQIEESQRAP